ncbi:hypothetical protein Q5752_001503 [Cryptotrichosporon argae]
MAPTPHVLLVLPLTPELLSNPHPLLPTIYKSLALASTSLNVLFTGPLYAALRRSRAAAWDPLQRFLGNVYATLAAAQWKTGMVDMDVEVHFEGEDGDVRDQVGTPGLVLVLQGYELPGYLRDMPHPKTVPVPPLLSAFASDPLPALSEAPTYPVVALGGTFDHLHAAHKLLLHLALFLATRKVIVGVVADRLLASKSNAALVEPIDARLEAVRAFLRRCGATTDAGAANAQAQVHADVVEIQDALGPTAHDADIHALVVSRETLSGGAGVNRTRAEKGMGELDIFVVDVISSSLDEAADAVRRDEADEASALAEEHGAEGDGESEGRRRGRRQSADADLESVRTVDLSAVMDESRLKEMKMGSTAIRAWLAHRHEQEEA